MNAKEKEPTDIQIRYAVLDQLAKDQNIRSTNISVGSTHGVITQTGYVFMDEEKIEAEKTARKVKGVMDVENVIQVVPHLILTDSDITIEHDGFPNAA